MRHLYLDYNATTPIAPSVQEAMLPFLAEFYGNPSSGHALGRACREAVEEARVRVADLLGADRDEILFTAGGTESNNTALKGVLLERAVQGKGHLIISNFEHPAIVEPARFLERMGCDVTEVPCNQHGIVEPHVVESALRGDTVLVSIMHANNEIGTVQPIRQIAEICHARDVLIHTDAAQSTAKLSTLVAELGVDMLTIAGHKIYAPKGVGALYVKRGTAFEPLLHGAAHEAGFRAGTENVPFIVGLGKAASLAHRALSESGDRLASLRDRLLTRLRAVVGDGMTVNGSHAERLPNTLSVNFPNVQASEMLQRLPELCASTGAACHSGLQQVSTTLQALGLPDNIARGTMRLSVGWYTSEEDIDRAASLLIDAWEVLRDN